MKNIWKRVLSLSLVTTLLVTGCSTVTPGVQQQAANTQITSISDVTPIADLIKMRSVNVTIQKEELYGDQVQISSSFGEFKAKTSVLAKSSQPLNVNSESPQLITLFDDKQVDGTRAPMALSVLPNPNRSQTVLISPQSTAEALVFMDPLLASDESGMADKVMTLIKSQPETKELARIIEQRTQKDPQFLYKDDAQQNQALSKAVNAVVNKLADEYDSKMKSAQPEPANRVQGIEINVSDQTDMTATFEMKNYKKRMVDLYFNNSGRPIYKESLRSAWDFIDLDNIALGFRPYVRKQGFDIQRPMDQVEVIGMGLKDIKQFKENWPNMSTPEKMKYGMPMAQGLMSDFVSPVISIISGFNVNKVWHVGLMKLVTGLPILEIINLYRNKEFGKAFKLILSSTIKNLLEKNGALLRELLQAAGLSLTEAFIKRFTAIIGIFNLIRYAIEAIRAMYTYATTNIYDTFKVQYDPSGKLSFLKNTNTLSVAKK